MGLMSAKYMKHSEHASQINKPENRIVQTFSDLALRIAQVIVILPVIPLSRP